MKKLLVVAGAMVAMFAFSGSVMAAGEPQQVEKEMTAQEWAAFKSNFLSKKPTALMQRAFPGCNVCTSTPVCKAGFRKTGYTDMVNYVVTEGWGDIHPSAGGYVAIMSRTITQNGICVHDHVKGAVCNKM